MEYQIKPWNTSTAIKVLTLQPDAPMFILNRLFGRTVLFDTEYVEMERLSKGTRKVAPFVMPMQAGKPVYEKSSRIERFKPAYLKPKDPVDITRVLNRQPGHLLDPAKMTPQSRYNAIKADIFGQQKMSIQRRWEVMGAKAAFDGKVVIEGPGYPTQMIDFNRDPSLTVVKAAGAKWGEAGVSIVDDMDEMANLVFAADGGAVDTMLVSLSAWKVMQKDPEIRELRNKNYGESESTLQRGMTGVGEIKRVGDINGIEVFVYRDYYETVGENGEIQKHYMLDEGDIVMFSSSSVDGVRAFGAIQDLHSGFVPAEMFPRNFVENGDPAVEEILTQSAPLPVPLNPNATLKATVL